jgi:hypothetical protein
MQATAAMRNEPWYAALLKTWGLSNPPPGVNGGNPVDAQGQPAKLSDQQQQQLIASARQAGIGISDSYSIDENGQIAKPDSHMLRNLAIGGALVGSLFIPGVTEAIVAGLHAGGSALAGMLTGAGGTGGGGSVLNAITGGAGAVSKIGSLLNIGKDAVTNVGTQSAALENQLANNRITGAKVDQGGPAADAVAFRNAMRSGIVSRMDPNQAPLSINGHFQPQLVTPENVDYAKTMQANLAARQAAGKTPTEFGVPDPTQEELDARKRASTAATTGSVLDTGSKIANLFGLLNNKKTPSATDYLTNGPNEPTTFFDTTDPSANDGFSG